MTDETNILLLQKCYEICQLFGRKNLDLSVTIGDFNFTVKHGMKGNTSEKIEKKRKYASPSTRRRNAARLAAYKAKKAAPSVEEVSPLEPPGVGRSPPGLLPGEDNKINTRDDPTNLETRRVDVPLVVAVDVHPPPIPPSNVMSVAKLLAREPALMVI